MFVDRSYTDIHTQNGSLIVKYIKSHFKSERVHQSDKCPISLYWSLVTLLLARVSNAPNIDPEIIIKYLRQIKSTSNAFPPKIFIVLLANVILNWLFLEDYVFTILGI